MSNSWKQGSTRGHRRARALVLANNRATNGGRCTLQIDGSKPCPVHTDRPCQVCTGKATQAHHTRGKKVTGDDPRHMVATCAPCNYHIGDPAKHDPQPTPRTRW